MGKTVFDLYKDKLIFFKFLFMLSFKKLKNTFPLVASL